MKNTIYGYNNIPNVSLLLTEWHGPAIDDLGQFDGRRYISVPAGAGLANTLAKQDPRLRCKRASKEELDGIKAVSPAIWQINQDIATAIRARYSVDDEFKALRTLDPNYVSFVAEQVAAGKAKKTGLGFDEKFDAAAKSVAKPAAAGA